MKFASIILLAAAAKPELIHPGVMKYFREIGLVK